jgi:hypothetical protein
MSSRTLLCKSTVHPDRTRRLHLFLGTVLLVGATIGLSPCHAQDSVPDNREIVLNYVYAAQLGFGGFNIGGLSVNIYQVPFGWKFPLYVTDEPWELRVKVPVGYGRFRFKGETEGAEAHADLDTLSGGTGLELNIPVLPFLFFKPFFNFGVVDDVRRNVSGEEVNVNFPFSYYFTGGLGSLIEYNFQGLTLGYGNALTYAANEAFDDSAGESYAAFETGVDVRHPLGFSVDNYKPDAEIFFIYYHFFSPVKFTQFLEEPLEITDQYEFGISFGFDKPSKIWFLEDPRLGASYRFDGDFSAIRLNFGFPF